jgi:adenylate cyclase
MCARPRWRARLIHARNGIIDKLIGDGLMAFWTAPFSRGESHAADACLAALAQQRAIGELQQRLPDILGLRRELPDFRVRMGLATGDLVVGTIGAPTARSFTVIGDTVNLASRLEGANNTYETRILVEEETFQLAESDVEGREIDITPCSAKWNRCACTRSWRRPEAFPMRSKNCAACSPRGWRPIAPVTGIAQSSALPNVWR